MLNITGYGEYFLLLYYRRQEIGDLTKFNQIYLGSRGYKEKFI